MNSYKQAKDDCSIPFLESELIEGVLSNSVNIDNKILNIDEFIEKITKSINSSFLFNVEAVTNLMKFFDETIILKDETIDRSLDSLSVILAYQLIYVSDKICHRIGYVYNDLYYYDGIIYKLFKRDIDIDTSSMMIRLIKEMMNANKISYKLKANMNKIHSIFNNIIKGKKMNYNIKNFLALRNKVLVIEQNNIKLIDHTPEIFVTAVADYDYDKNATCTMFQNFLDRVLPDKEYQQALQEYVGYCLTDDFTLEKIVILLGNGSNGKSVFQHIITAMLGEDNVSTYGLNELIAGNHQDNARYTAFQKKVNIGTEIGNIKDASMDIFKKMISNEQVMVRKMHHEPFNIKWKPKLMFNANTLPSAEITKAYERRMLIIPFEVSINSNEADPRLAKKIITSELAGVLNWALQGLERIYKNNLKLTISDNLIMTSRDHLNATNTVITFLEESGILPTSDNSTIYKLKDLMGKYIDYMKSIGGVHKSYRSFEMTLRLENFIIVKTTTTRVKCVVAKIPAVLGLHPVYEKFQKVMS